MCISYEYYIWGVSKIHTNRRLWSYGFTRFVSFNVPDPGTIWDGTVHALRLHYVPPCLLFILDRQRKLAVIHRYIVPHTPLLNYTVHNFGRLTCVSPQWNRPQCDDTVTSSLASVILHACSEFCVRFWDCPLVRYDNAIVIPRMMIRHHPPLTGCNIPHSICWCNRICCVQLKVLIFEGSSHTWTYSYSNVKWSVIVELSLQAWTFSGITCL